MKSFEANRLVTPGFHISSMSNVYAIGVTREVDEDASHTVNLVGMIGMNSA